MDHTERLPETGATSIVQERPLSIASTSSKVPGDVREEDRPQPATEAISETPDNLFPPTLSSLEEPASPNIDRRASTVASFVTADSFHDESEAHEAGPSTDANPSPFDDLPLPLPPPAAHLAAPSPEHDAPPESRRPGTVRWDVADDDETDQRPGTARPGTTRRQSFPRARPTTDGSSSIDEDDEEDNDVFAFARPPTSDNPASGAASHSLSSTETTDSDAMPDTVGPFDIDIGGYHHQHYDPTHPPPFSGRNNPNNGVFAFALHNRRPQGPPSPPQMLPQVPHTASPTVGQSADEHSSDDVRIAGSTSSIMSTSDDMTESRLDTGVSYPMTALTGDQTVPDGKTTWGDGNGGEHKAETDGGEEGEYDWIEEDSPFPEVRASVSNIDDVDMPALTLRAWLIGMTLVMIVAGANTFLIFRYPAPTIPVLAVQMAVYPIGKFLAWALPIRDYTLPRWLGGFTFSLNPCPFNVKEHTIIVMMACVSLTPAYALHSIVAAEVWYHRKFGFGFSYIYMLCTQVMGLSMGGIIRRYVVWPASMIWPGVLVMTTNLNTLHAEADIGTGSMSRRRFLFIVLGCTFLWYFVPGFLFKGLSSFSYACWIVPKNLVVNQLFGIHTGLGMGILTFDWSQISWLGSPLTAPWWAQANVAIGLVTFYWFVAPMLHYTNTWYTKYLPMSSTLPADRFQNVYNVTEVLTPEFTLNTTAYADYSPVYLTSTFTVTYMLAFALTTSILVGTALSHGSRLWRAFRHARSEADDIHMKLMRKYKEVPDWWFLCIFVGCVALGIVAVEVFHTGLPVWGFLVAVAIGAVYVLPCGIVFAMANLEPTFNLIAELIPGYAFPGMPIPGMMFKTFSVQAMTEALVFARDMKLGHYMKIPPRATFIAQVSAVTVASLVQLGVKTWMFSSIPDMCSTKQKSSLTCPASQTMFTSSVVWGLIGPARLFSKGGIYSPQVWMLLVGALLPIPFWLYSRKFPNSWVRNVNVIIVFCVALFIPPASGINVASFIVAGFVFQFFLRRRHFAWWCKYNYVLSCALDVGTVLGALFVFVVLLLPGLQINWWGNTVYQKTLDYTGLAMSPAPQAGFGPTTWKV